MGWRPKRDGAGGATPTFVIRDGPDQAGEIAAQGDRGVQPGPWPVNDPAVTGLWRNAGPGSAIPDVASEGTNLWDGALLSDSALALFANSASKEPGCALAKTHKSGSIAEANVQILYVAIQIDAPL